MSYKSFAYFLAASTIFHAMVFSSSYAPFFHKNNRTPDVILFSYIAAPKVPDVQKPAPLKEASFTRKKIVQPRAVFQDKAPVVRTAAQLLADPKRGGVFIGYFSKIKENIHEVVRRKKSSSDSYSGQAAVNFVLRSSGEIEGAWINEHGTDCSPEGRTFAENCVRQAGPFSAFPKELDTEKLSLSITILFDNSP